MTLSDCAHCGEEIDVRHPSWYQCSDCLADEMIRVMEGTMVNKGYYSLFENREIDIVTGETCFTKDNT